MSMLVKDCNECGTSMGLVSRNRMFCNKCRIEREDTRVRLRNARVRQAKIEKQTKEKKKVGFPRISMEIIKELCSDCHATRHASILMDARAKLPDSSETAKFLDDKIADLHEQMAVYERHDHEVRYYPEKEEYRIYAVYEDEKPTATGVGDSKQNIAETDDENA